MESKGLVANDSIQITGGSVKFLSIIFALGWDCPLYKNSYLEELIA